MPGNFDDIIRQVLGMNQQAPELMQGEYGPEMLQMLLQDKGQGLLGKPDVASGPQNIPLYSESRPKDIPATMHEWDTKQRIKQQLTGRGRGGET